jgi:hypothetical protein
MTTNERARFGQPSAIALLSLRKRSVALQTELEKLEPRSYLIGDGRVASVAS